MLSIGLNPTKIARTALLRPDLSIYKNFQVKYTALPTILSLVKVDVSEVSDPRPVQVPFKVTAIAPNVTLTRLQARHSVFSTNDADQNHHHFGGHWEDP